MADTESASQDTQEGADLDWIPENYRRDTLEETARVLLESQKGAQREMLEATTARRNLEQLVAQQQAALEAATQQQATPQQDEPWEDWYAQDPIATQKALAEQAAEAKFNQLMQASQQQTQPAAEAQAELIANYAYGQLEDRYGKLSSEKQEQMRQTIADNPHLLPNDVANSPQKLVNALDIVYKLTGPDEAAAAATQQDLQRTMKIQAQSASGAAGRPSPADDAEARWQEIANAKTGTLGL